MALPTCVEGFSFTPCAAMYSLPRARDKPRHSLSPSEAQRCAHGRISLHELESIQNVRRAPMFVFEFEKPLFEFEYERPHCEPLLALPPTYSSSTVYCLSDLVTGLRALAVHTVRSTIRTGHALIFLVYSFTKRRSLSEFNLYFNDCTIILTIHDYWFTIATSSEPPIITGSDQKARRAPMPAYEYEKPLFESENERPHREP